VYGATKLEGERRVFDNHPDPTVVRLSFVYGVHGTTGVLQGFPAWVRDQVTAGETCSLFTDQWVSPTRAGQAAYTLFDLHETCTTGLFHVACRSCVTPFEFGRLLCDHLDVSPDLLRRGSRAEVDRDARRPACTCLDTAAVAAALDYPQPSLSENLDAIAGSL
jgi:dTDP-4-dehydrorhamnose reductase